MKKLIKVLFISMMISSAAVQEAKPIPSPYTVAKTAIKLFKGGYKNIAFYITQLLGLLNKKPVSVPENIELNEFSDYQVYIVEGTGETKCCRCKKYSTVREEETEEDK